MPKSKPTISIENVVASATIDQPLNLKDITKKFPEVEWNPDLFPGAVFRLKKPEDCYTAFQYRKDGLHWFKIRRYGKKGSKNSGSRIEKRQNQD